MHRPIWVSKAVLALVAALALASTAQAATVTGSVAGARGYRLLVMSPTRIVAMVKLNARGRFTVRSARGLTLQLLRPNNTFFGPIVIAAARGRAYEGLSGRNLTLGTIKLHRSYAAPAKRVAKRALDQRVWAYADHAGKPIGAGNLGLVRRKHQLTARSADAGSPGSGALPPGGDPTHVGIVTAFNADATGAGVPSAENPASARASGNGLFTEVYMPLEMSVNVDAFGITPEQVSNVVKQDLRLDFYLDGHAAGGAAVSGVSVDCGSLTYCASGNGTGTVSNTPTSGLRWDGTVPANPNSPGVFSTQIAPNVGTSQISPGDVFLLHYQTTGGDFIAPTALTLYFLTVPALASYDAGAGTQNVAYPVTTGAAGTRSNPVRMTSGKMTLHLWRPQRAAFPGESGQFYDVGRLHYGIPITPGGGGREVGCAPQFYSNLSPSLSVSQTSQDQFYNQLFPLHDGADDAPANAANQIGFTVDLAGCLAANGISTAAPVDLPLSAVDEPRQGGTDRGVQTISVCLPGCDASKGSGPSGPGQNPGSPQG
jgi:hypothetical protein